MASAVSYEYLKSIQGVPGGIPVLDDTGAIPPTQLPDVVTLFKGRYTDAGALRTAVPTAGIANYAFIDSTSSFWYWNTELLDAGDDPEPDWVNQEISEENYLGLTPLQRSVVPYLVIPPLYIPPTP
ncbi:MAG: hypothetical protein FWE42_06565 [Defluviitaleaceae bacterium]|nr:hypothetical protein [Defluviitaleaceae bacterium]